MAATCGEAPEQGGAVSAPRQAQGVHQPQGPGGRALAPPAHSPFSLKHLIRSPLTIFDANQLTRPLAAPPINSSPNAVFVPFQGPQLDLAHLVPEVDLPGPVRRAALVLRREVVVTLALVCPVSTWFFPTAMAVMGDPQSRVYWGR